MKIVIKDGNIRFVIPIVENKCNMFSLLFMIAICFLILIMYKLIPIFRLHISQKTFFLLILFSVS